MWPVPAACVVLSLWGPCQGRQEVTVQRLGLPLHWVLVPVFPFEFISPYTTRNQVRLKTDFHANIKMSPE